MAKVKMTLVGLNGNALSLIGAFSREAKKQGWTKEQVEAVTKEAMKDDYNHLLCTLSDNCEDVEDDSDEDDE